MLGSPSAGNGQLCSRLGPSRVDEGRRGEGRRPGGQVESQRMRDLGVTALPWTLPSPIGHLSWILFPLVKMTSFLYQAPAALHSNGLRPQQDHPDSGRHHLPPPAWGQLSKGGGSGGPGASCPLLPGPASPQPPLPGRPAFCPCCPRSECWDKPPHVCNEGISPCPDHFPGWREAP